MTDPFLRFWFRCFYPYESMFEFDNMEQGLKRIQPLLEQHIALCFESLCRTYVRQRMARWNCIRVGRQWSRHYEIDVAGVDEDNRFTLFGECKWSNNPVGDSVLNELKDKVDSHGLPTTNTPYWLLFSRSGFTEALKNRASTDKHLVLVASILAQPRAE
jgi:AAA+ ATPase superfamily predicted ATPase